MASIAMMIGGAVVNALAFTGSNFLFSSINQGNAERERKRHDLALEELSRAKIEYEKNRTALLDYLNERIRKEARAKSTFQDINQALIEYNEVTGNDLEFPEELRREPKLSDFYSPSEEQKDAEIIFIIGGTAIIGYLVYKYI